MVSIGQGSFSNATAHDHSHNISDDLGSKEHLLRSPLATDGNENLGCKTQVKRQFPGVIFICLYIVLLLVFGVMDFICSDVLHLKIFGGVQEPFAFLTVLHVIVWVVTFVYDRYLHFHHHALRKYGYLNLFLKTKELRRVPVMLFSIGNAVLLLIVAFTASRSDEEFSLIRVFHIIATIEVGISLIVEFIYLAHVWKFNRQNKMPDVYNNDATGAFDVEIHNTPEVGFGESDAVDDVLEKQSEMIQYLQQHNRNLSRRIIDLTQMLPQDEQQSILKASNVNPNLYLQNTVLHNP